MFTKPFDKYACVGDKITCEVDGFAATATVYRDDYSDAPDKHDDGFWPSNDPKAAGYVLPENYDDEFLKALRVMQAWKDDRWFYCGVAVTVERADIALNGKYANALWGIDCNYPGSDNAYLSEVANELLSEALDAAKASVGKLCAA